MDSSGGFPIDILLFGMIAAFLILRLRSVLGRRTGFERAAPPASRPEAQGPVIEGRAEPAPTRTLPAPDSAAGQGLVRIRAVDASFDPARFLQGAEHAFRLIVAAFAAGKREDLRPLLTEETYRAFESAIVVREAAGEIQRTEIRAVPEATIEEAKLTGTQAEITVRFVSSQVNVTLGRDGQPVGGADAVTEIIDIWTFARDLARNDPAWRLAAARAG